MNTQATKSVGDLSADDQMKFYYWYLGQSNWWYPKGRKRVEITSMGARWRRNAARFMQRRAKHLAFQYTFGEILVMATPTKMTEVIGEFNGEPVERVRMFSQFDMMSESAEDAFHEWQNERQEDPLAWLLTTPLYRAMVSAPCCNGSGLADYAAVPCPNPDCPVPAPGSEPEQSAEWQAREERKRTVGKHHLTECPMYPGGHAELGCQCEDYSPEWTL